MTATAYLVVRGERYKWSGLRPKPITGAKVAGVRQSKPDHLGLDEIVVKVQVELPKRAFEPLEPEALIVVPEELVQHVVTAEAVDNG